MEDLALLYIDQPFHLSKDVNTAPLNDHIRNLQGQTATLSGWGWTETEYSPNFLSQTSVKIFADFTHRGRSLFKMKNANPTNTGTCLGDSGGNPL